MKLYTKKGDKGHTSLYGWGKDMSKEHDVFEVLGDLDELSANIGVVLALAKSDITHIGFLRNVQRELLDIGSFIATAPSKWSESKYRERNDKTTVLEQKIDVFTENTSPLTQFILPGVGVVDAQIHVCRSVCRRAERHLCAYVFQCEEEEQKQCEETLKYINRLSDYFFALARYTSGGAETTRY